MAYYEKYRKNITRSGGPNYRVSIYESRNSSLGSGYPYEIGGLVACNLVLQGQRSDVFDPITKTSLELVLADISDHPTYTQSGTTVKQGQWEEFFTPDSMKYKVVVSRLTGSNNNTVTPIWTGYVTPDSYEEQLIYHGTISIIARDNLGHLGDIDFDGVDNENGMIFVSSLVSQALDRVGAMSLKDLDTDFSNGNHILVQDAAKALTAVNLKNLYLNITACRGRKWLDVLEDVLESTGLTLRYNFDNTFLLAEMGMIPEYLDGTRAGNGNRTFKMLQNSGRRQFIAAARAIEETFDAEYGGLLDVETQSGDYISASVTMGGSSVTVDKPTSSHPFQATGAIGMIDPLSGHYYNPRVGSIFYSGADMFITALKSTDNLSNYGSIKAEIPIAVGGENVTMRFKFYVGAYSHDGDYISGGAIFSAQSPRPGRRPDGTYNQSMSVRYKIAYYNGTTRTYLNDQGVFTSTDYTFMDTVTSGFNSSQGRYGADALDVEKEIRMPNSAGTLEIIFLPFLLSNNHAPTLSTGTYHGRINGLEITQDDESWKGYHIVTNYDSKNNVMLERGPKFGQVSGVISPKVIQNGLYIKGTGGQFPAAGAFYWRSKDTDNLRLAVLIHQQMLQFFSRPEKQITADIIDATSGVLSFSNTYLYGGEKYIIQSGSLDLIDNVLRSAVLRTWKSWASLWGDEPVANYLTVSPSNINLTNVTSEGVRVDSNTSWRIKTLPSGLSASVSSGTGPTNVYISLNGAFSGSGTVVFETTDHALTASVSVVRDTTGNQLTLESVGLDVETMEFPLVTGLYYVEINFDTDNNPLIYIDYPSWVHFDDPQIDYVPGVYNFWIDELPSSSPRDGYIHIQEPATGNEVQLYIKQIG